MKINQPRLFVYIPLCLASQLTQADQLDSYDELFALSMEELISTNVTIASRSDISLSKAPASVSVYTRKDIQRMGIDHLDELLNFIPGYMNARSDTARLNTAVVRGRRVNENSPDILVLLDGIRLNDPVLGGGFASTTELSLDNIKQVEIIRGPGSALYGSNAFSGVINVITDKHRKQLSLSSNENHAIDGAAQWHHSVAQFEVSAFVRKYRDSGQNYAPIIEYFGRFNPTRDPKSGEDLQLRLGYGGLSLTASWVRRIKEQFVQGGIVGNDHNKIDRSGRYLQLKYSHEFTPDWSTAFYYEDDRVTQDEFLLFYPAEVAADSFLGWTDGSIVDLVGGNNRASGDRRYGFDGSWITSAQHQIQFGGVFQQEFTGLNAFHGNYDAKTQKESDGLIMIPSTTGIQQGYTLPGGVPLDLIKPYERDIYGAYLQSQWQISPQLQLTSGIRYDDYENIGNNTSLRAGLVYSLDSTQHLKLLYGEAFRAPTITDTNADFSSTLLGNPDLQPELISTIDLIWQKAWSSVLLTGNLFYSEIDDEMVVEVHQPIPGFNSLRLVNKGQQQLSGIELEFQANLNDHLNIKSGYSYYNQFQALGGAKSHGFFAVNYHVSGLNLNLSGYYHDRILSRQPDDTAQGEALYLDSFWQANAKISFRYRGIDFYIKADNLLNKQYSTYSAAVGMENGVPGKGREVTFGLEWNF